MYVAKLVSGPVARNCGAYPTESFLFSRKSIFEIAQLRGPGLKNSIGAKRTIAVVARNWQFLVRNS